MAPCLVWGDFVWRHVWSGGTLYGAMVGPGGLCMAQGDDPRRRREDHIWDDSARIGEV